MQGSVLLVEGFVFYEIAHQIEDATVKHLQVHFDGFIADGLSKVGFSDARRPKKKHILGLADEVASGQIEDVFSVDGRIKTPVEVLQRFQAAKISGLPSAAAGAH
jgi:hypothetical protein